MLQQFAPPVERLTLASHGYIIEVWPDVCGCLASFDITVNGRIIPLFRKTAERETYDPIFLSCWPLLPYSNRIAHGRFEFDGASYEVAQTVDDVAFPLHGVGWQRGWQVIESDSASCRLQLNHTPDEHWPFPFMAEQVFALGPEGLTITTSLTNRHKHATPYGLGQHPYIVRPPGTKLFAAVEGVWVNDHLMLPFDHLTELPEEWRLQDGCNLDQAALDNCFSGLVGPVQVVWPDRSRLVIQGSDELDFLFLFNRPAEDYVCAELVTHMADAFNRV